MLSRITALALNTYTEAARARVLLGVFVMALAASAYSVIVAALSLHNEVRVVADLGSASMSLFAIVVAILLGSTSLYRELELKTIFPILSRPVRRWEYVVAKYLGTMLTVALFVTLDAALVFAFLALESGGPSTALGVTASLLLAALVAALVLARRHRVIVVIPWALVAAGAMWSFAASAGADRQVVLASAVLAVGEVGIVAAVATLFASFSSPILTATFTVLVFIIGRSSDTLAHLPHKIFGDGVASVGKGLARVFPNLHVYVPSRELLLGRLADSPVWPYVLRASLHALCYAVALLAVSVLAFRKRDFP
jgi:ABC-type transport system involved in multi-copper enzyme maturation permease subunit